MMRLILVIVFIAAIFLLHNGKLGALYRDQQKGQHAAPALGAPKKGLISDLFQQGEDRLSGGRNTASAQPSHSPQPRPSRAAKPPVPVLPEGKGSSDSLSRSDREELDTLIDKVGK